MKYELKITFDCHVCKKEEDFVIAGKKWDEVAYEAQSTRTPTTWQVIENTSMYPSHLVCSEKCYKAFLEKGFKKRVNDLLQDYRKKQLDNLKR